MSTNSSMKIVDQTSSNGDNTSFEAAMKALPESVRATIQAKISELEAPAERSKKFRVVTTPDGRSLVQGYGLGIRLDRSQAHWLCENVNVLREFLAAHPEVK